MGKINFKKGLLLFVCSLLISCSTSVPITNRSQIKIVSDKKVAENFSKTYKEIIEKHKEKNELVVGTEDFHRLKKIGNKLSKAVEEYLVENNLNKKLEELKWEFNLVKSDEVNAWCGPGGKIVFYTGIMDYIKNDEEFAFVMGHEIGHALAGHSTEDYSKRVLLQTGLAIYDLVTLGVFRDIAIMGAGAIYFHGNRKQEYEADQLGMIFMAKAGYNPESAIEFQKTLGTVQKDYGKGSDFMSTHPRSKKRIEEMIKFLPEAMKYYKVENISDKTDSERKIDEK